MPGITSELAKVGYDKWDADGNYIGRTLFLMSDLWGYNYWFNDSRYKFRFSTNDFIIEAAGYSDTTFWTGPPWDTRTYTDTGVLTSGFRFAPVFVFITGPKDSGQSGGSVQIGPRVTDQPNPDLADYYAPWHDDECIQ